MLASHARANAALRCCAHMRSKLSTTHTAIGSRACARVFRGVRSRHSSLVVDRSRELRRRELGLSALWSVPDFCSPAPACATRLPRGATCLCVRKNKTSVGRPDGQNDQLSSELCGRQATPHLHSTQPPLLLENFPKAAAQPRSEENEHRSRYFVV
jgi:hypothetical protein